MSNTKQQTIPNLIVIDKDWLEKEIQKLVDEYNSTNDDDQKIYCIAKITSLNFIVNNSYPLGPIVEDAWLQGKKNNVMWANDKEYEVLKQNYLSQPIKLEK